MTSQHCFISFFQVFIHNGSLHIIPLPTNPLEAAILPTEKPGYANAYNLVTSTVINTKASKRIEECILKKIRWLGTIMQLLQIVFISVFWNTSKEFPNFFFIDMETHGNFLLNY